MSNNYSHFLLYYLQKKKKNKKKKKKKRGEKPRIMTHFHGSGSIQIPIFLEGEGKWKSVLFSRKTVPQCDSEQ